MAAIQIVRGWLDEVSYTAATWNLEAHMRLVSRHVKVTGIPNISHIDYNGWKVRRRNEFDKKLLQSLTYRLHKILSDQDNQILFTVEETMKSSRGSTYVIDKEVSLRREDDGMWRVYRERFDRILVR